MLEIWRLRSTHCCDCDCSAPNRKKPVPSQPRAAALRQHAVELALLAVGGFLVAAHLLGARRVAAGAAIDRGELAFEARAKLALIVLSRLLGSARTGRPRLRRGGRVGAERHGACSDRERATSAVQRESIVRSKLPPPRHASRLKPVKRVENVNRNRWIGL